MMGVKAPVEMKQSDNECPDSWEMADLEESMQRLMPSGCSLAEERLDKVRNSFNSDAVLQVDEFLREALQNPNDRLTILRLEQDVEKFVRNPRQQQYEFPPMSSSYLRLAAHRVAQHYHLLTSVLDSSGTEGYRIIVRKSGDKNLSPPIRLADIPVYSEGTSQANAKFVIKQRPQGNYLSNSDSLATSSSVSGRSNPSKSVEERNEEYNRARARIFRSEMEQRAYDELVEAERKNREAKERDEQTRKDKEKEKDKSRQKVAIFRDREKDRKDPDYDRNYDRYSQRFDPGFGLNQPPFGMQARYTPVVNYNTEFPQLSCPPVRQPPPPPVPTWRPPAFPPFNPPPPPPRVPANMATYMSQYPYPRPYPYNSQVSQPEANSAQARRH